MAHPLCEGKGRTETAHATQSHFAENWSQSAGALHGVSLRRRDPGLTAGNANEILNYMVEHHNERLNDLFHALASPTRRAIMSMLAERPYNISELVPEFDMSLAAVSKHVKSLERAGLIEREIMGRNHVCRLNPDALSEAHRWLGAYAHFWQERLDARERVLADEISGVRRGGAKQK
jgi:DNA-binding transcriptional ArsR family regulator